MDTALVTGSIDRSHVIAVELKREGFEAFAWEGPKAGAADESAPGSVDCYVQLPPSPAPAAHLMNRLDVLCAVAPLLAADAAVVLVADEPGWDTASRRAFQALAEAAVVEEAGPGRRVAVVEGGSGSQIAGLARREWNQARAVSLADLAPDLSYVDWRNEVMNLTSSAETTYFGWQRSDGSRRTAVLRRSVLSPVPGGDDGGYSLGRAVLTDALGPHTFDELQHWDTTLAEAFFEEVIRPLPPEAFELPIHAVATWVVRRSLSDQPVLGLGTVAAGAASGEDRSGS